MQASVGINSNSLCAQFGQVIIEDKMISLLIASVYSTFGDFLSDSQIFDLGHSLENYMTR